MKADHVTKRAHFRSQAIMTGLSGCGMQNFDLTKADGFPLLDLYRGDGDSSPDTAHEVLAWAAGLLTQSPAGAALLRHAAESGWSAGLADLHNGGYFINPESRRILLDSFSLDASALGNSLYFRNGLLTGFIRALRDIWHEGRVSATEESGFAPEYILMIERARAADCDTATVLVCWELRGAGFPDVWRHVLGGTEGDMAIVFTRYLERDPGALFDGAALAYAFRQWYADSSRVDGCDHETLESLDGILSGTDSRNPFGRAMPAGTDVESLSVLPDGICYLAGLGETVLRDPFFAGMNDPVNQTHLFHLIYDMEVTMVNNVPFRDSALARRIFPGADIIKTWR